MNLEIILLLFTAFVLGLSLFPIFIKLYAKNDIMDRRETRKVHLNEVPTMGGVPIFLAFLLTCFIWLPYYELLESRYIIGTLTFVFFLGLRDDFINLKPLTKLLYQILPAIAIYYLTDIHINSLYGFFTSTTFPIYISFPITIFTIIVITNSINLIDGLDGLAGSISTVVLLFFGIWFSLTTNTAIGLLLIAMAGSVIAFIRYNWQPAKIFMGDTGALLLGFLIALASIKFLNENYQLTDSNSLHFNGGIASTIAVLIIPLFDTLRIFAVRIIKKKSPFTADKNHVHHVLFRLGFNHIQVTLILVGVNVIFIGLAILFKNVSDQILVPIIFFIGINTSLYLDYLIIKQMLSKKKEAPVSFMEIIKSSRKAS